MKDRKSVKVSSRNVAAFVDKSSLVATVKIMYAQYMYLIMKQAIAKFVMMLISNPAFC